MHVCRDMQDLVLYRYEHATAHLLFAIGCNGLNKVKDVYLDCTVHQRRWARFQVTTPSRSVSLTTVVKLVHAKETKTVIKEPVCPVVHFQAFSGAGAKQAWSLWTELVMYYVGCTTARRRDHLHLSGILTSLQLRPVLPYQSAVVKRNCRTRRLISRSTQVSTV